MQFLFTDHALDKGRWELRRGVALVGLELQVFDLLVNKDNARAIRFFEKHGFAYAGEDINPASGKPVNRMNWRS